MHTSEHGLSLIGPERPRQKPPAPKPEGITPESVYYHTGDDVCARCEHLEDDGATCEKLKIQVDAVGGHCILFSASDMGEEIDDTEPEGVDELEDLEI